MGFLTTITIHNDALHVFKQDPKAFGEAILNGIDEANSGHKATTVGFNCYANYIKVQHSRHADDHAVYIHKGNTVTLLDSQGGEFKQWAEVNKESALRALKFVRAMVKDCSKYIKEMDKNERR